MEKIFWVRSEEYDGKIDDGLKEVNSFFVGGHPANARPPNQLFLYFPGVVPLYFLNVRIK